MSELSQNKLRGWVWMFRDAEQSTLVPKQDRGDALEPSVSEQEEKGMTSGEAVKN